MNFQKIDPIWLTKWAGSLLIISGMALTASEIYPLNMCMQLMGVMGWLQPYGRVRGECAMKDRASSERYACEVSLAW